MTRLSHRRFLVPAIGAILLLVGYLTWSGLDQNLVYYLTPDEALDQRAQFPDGSRFRLGGLVVPGSVVDTGEGVEFEVTDGAATVSVVHTGTPPQLFREDIGVVAEGAWDGRLFRSDQLLVRHDEEYRAPEGDGPYRPPEAGPANDG